MNTSPLLDPAARLVIGHRGNRTTAPENTAEAIDQAIQAGADAVEFDVRVTRDGVPVLMHDALLDRTTNATGRLDAMTLGELSAVNAGAKWTSADERYAIPTLEQVFDRFRSTHFVIEVKELAAAGAVEAMIRRFDAGGRVIVGSASSAAAQRLYRSGLRTCASMVDATLLIPFALLKISPPKPRFDVLSITPQFHGMPIPVGAMAAMAQRLGVPTHVWTVNDPAQARQFWSAGVSAIVTDDPVAMLRARSQ